MTAWIKTSYAADEGEIFYKTINPQPMRMAITPTTAQVVLYDGTNNPSVSGTVTVNDGSPHFIAGIVDRPNSEIVLYIDGEYNNKATDTTVGDLRNTNALLIGKKDNDGQPFGGIIGEVAIYNRRLTAQEIQHNYLATKWRYR